MSEQLTQVLGRIERDGDVVHITMMRAARRNSLARDHLTQLLCAVTEVGRSDATGMPKAVRYASQSCSAASLVTPYGEMGRGRSFSAVG